MWEKSAVLVTKEGPQMKPVKFTKLMSPYLDHIKDSRKENIVIFCGQIGPTVLWSTEEFKIARADQLRERGGAFDALHVPHLSCSESPSAPPSN